jgi:predicted ATPase
VTKSLVAADFNDAEARYRLLDTARAYALDKLLASGELAAMARRLAEHYRQRLLNVNNGDEASLEVTPAWAADLANIRAVLGLGSTANRGPVGLYWANHGRGALVDATFAAC